MCAMRAYLPLLLLAVSSRFAPTSAIWPAPKSFFQGHQLAKLSDDFYISFAGPLASNAPADLDEAAVRTLEQIRTEKHHILVPDLGESDRQTIKGSTELEKLELRLSSKGATAWLVDTVRSVAGTYATLSISEETDRPASERDESYSLHIPPSPSSKKPATLTAATSLGLLRGLESFTQLVYTLPDVYRLPTDVTLYASPEEVSAPVRYLRTPVSIQDEPAFTYRGLLVDTSRNFIPIEDLKRTIDAMSIGKLNTLHWCALTCDARLGADLRWPRHAVDAQSWPLHIPSHPDLVSKTAHHPSQIYTASDLSELVSYAGSRGVSIMVELDVPGHTAVLGDYDSDLVACREKARWWEYAAEPPSGQIRIADDKATAFVGDVFASVAKIFPGDMLSTGGDEIVSKCYDEDEPTQEALRAQNITLEEALAGFIRSTHQVLREHNKTPVVWEELALNHAADLGQDVIVAVWKSSANAKKVAEKGLRILQAPSDFAYLDCGTGGWLGANAEGNSWCDPFKTWQKVRLCAALSSA